MKNVVWEAIQGGDESSLNLIDMFQSKTTKDGKSLYERGKPFINEEGERVIPIYNRSTQEVVRTEKLGKEQQKSAGKTRPYMANLMAKGYMPGSRITGPMLDALEAAAEQADISGNPLTVKQLKQMEFDAVKNRRTGATAGNRLVLARKQNIEAAQGLLKDMQKTEKNLKYSPVKFLGALEKWKNKQLNDPVFTEYMTQRADALFVLGNALKQNGLTDKSIEVEEEAAAPTLSPKAFNAWLNTQVRALNRAADEMNKDYGFNLHKMTSVEPGTGGKNMPELQIDAKPKILGNVVIKNTVDYGDVTEADIQKTMLDNKMTREQVMKHLKGAEVGR